MAYVLGIDISTTSAKALLVDEQGVVVATHSTAQSLSTPKPLWSEQDPLEWWDGVVTSIRAVLQTTEITGTDIVSIGLTGQMHGLVLLDADGKVLRPAILWNDQRTQEQCDEITEKVGFERLIELTGNQALTGFTAPKILWVRQHEPDVYAEVAHILLPKDYIRFRLTGDYATDLAGAAGTSLLNVRERAWSQEVVDTLEIPTAWLPEVHEGTEVTGVISSDAASLTGLQSGTPVVGGGGDQAAGAVGVGAVEPNIWSLSLGTSGVVFAPLSQYAYEPEGRLHAFCHAVPGQWHFMGVMLSAAGSLQWYRDALAADIPFDDLLAPIGDIPAGSEGLQFLPYLTGERTPHPDPLARGGFIGLTVRHTQAHLTRAVLEGVGFGLKDSFTLIAEAGIPDDLQVRITGGGANSPIWRQILADILDVSLVSINTTEGGALGAALLATVPAGFFPDIQTACQIAIQAVETTEPQNSSAYQSAYEQYRSLYPALKPYFHNLVG